MTRILIGILLICLAFQLRAEDAAKDYIEPKFVPPPTGSLIILAPKHGTSPQIAEGEEFILRQLHLQLTAAGYRVAVLDSSNYASMWQEEVNAVGGLYDPNTGERDPVAYGRALGCWRDG